MAKTMTNQYAPDTVSAPGETLAEVIEERGMTQTELAHRLGMAHKTVNEIIQGKAPLTQGTALALERVLGISAGFWNRMEANYREFLARQEEEQRLAEQQEWLKQFPIKDMVKQGFVQKLGSAVDQMQELLGFLGVASPAQWDGLNSVALGRCRQSALDSDPTAVAVWLRRGEILAQQTNCEPFDLAKFLQALGEARTLTNELPEVFLPRLVEMGRECGVAIVFVPAIVRARVCGFTRWLTPTKALLQISDRYQRTDSFWFTFFHEAGHLVKHGKKDAFLEGEAGQEDEKEREADKFALDFLIPPEQYRALLEAKPRHHHEIQFWADSLGIAPGILVGQLHHAGTLSHLLCHDMRVKMTWRQN